MQTPTPPQGHPETDAYRRRLERIRAEVTAVDPNGLAYRGVAYRATAPRRANRRDLISGVGSLLHGGRWNPRGVFPTLYASPDLTTALEEILAQNRRNGLPDHESFPVVLSALILNLAPVLDLTDLRIRRRLGLSARRLIEEPHRRLQAEGHEALTQMLGRLARDLGYQGLIGPSAARSEGKVLAVFPDRIDDPEAIQIANVEHLPES